MNPARCGNPAAPGVLRSELSVAQPFGGSTTQNPAHKNSAQKNWGRKNT
jgi:hypothetical protein